MRGDPKEDLTERFDGEGGSRHLLPSDPIRQSARDHPDDDEPSADILALVDEALATASADPDDEHKGIALLTLAGVRRALFPSAPPYRPQTASVDRSEAPQPLPVAAE